MKRITHLSIIVLLLLAAVIFAGPTRSLAGDAERVLVHYAPGNGAAVQNALQRAGGNIHHAFNDLNVIAVTLSADALGKLRHNPNVVSIEEDARRYPMGDAAQSIPYGIYSVQAPEVWEAGYDGSGITVCIIDSGLYTEHEDIVGVDILGGYDNPKSHTGPWDVDGCGHGTHVAGTIAAVDNDTGVVGVAPGVSLFIVRVFGDDCQWAYSSTLLDAANHCADAGANIISMSLGGGKTIAEERAFQNLWDQGVLSIAAAGNDGNTEYSYPASYDSVVSVAALDESNVIADFSQQNDQVELAAPGVDVLSSVPWLATVELTVDDVTYSANHIEFAAYGAAQGLLVDGGLCDSTGDWEGNVVLCQRGEIDFRDKVINVQKSRGAAAVIYNNEPGGFFGTLGDGRTSDIPAISLSQEDGQYLVENKLGSTGHVESSISIPNSSYEAWGGTSMATPHVSGVAALLWSTKPNRLTNADIREAMALSALDLGDPGQDNVFGHGLVQAADALEYLSPGQGPKK